MSSYETALSFSGISGYNTGDIIHVNGSRLTWDGERWDYPQNEHTGIIPDGITYSTNTNISYDETTWKTGNNMANSTPGLYGDILFNRELTYQPYTARNIKTGKELGKVHEINPNSINGLGSNYSLYTILDAKGDVTYPLMSWNVLLEKLVG
jgi:hypothetical protein